jgi:hypothetical protein
MSFLDGADRESEKALDVFHHLVEFSLLEVGLVLRAKRGPLPFLVCLNHKIRITAGPMLAVATTQRSESDPHDTTSLPMEVDPQWMIMWPFDPKTT